MRKSILPVLILILNSVWLFGQNTDEVTIPPYQDRYCADVKRLESGQTDIDYQEFRHSFMESEQFKIASKKSTELASLKKKMYVQMGNSNYQEIIKITKQMLSIDYTSMVAHKILRQTYKIVGDTLNAKKYKAIQFGLLNSIVKNGDGKTCETAWPVIQLDEEYFVLEMIGATVQAQGVENVGKICDKMEVIVDGEKKTYYFEISKIVSGYKKLGIE